MAMAFSVTTTSLRAVVTAPPRRPNQFIVLLSRAARPHLRLGAARQTRLPVPLAASFSEDPRGYGLERPPHDVGSSSFRMYVGNLPWRLDDSRLAQLFSEHGTVVFAKIMRDFQTGRSKGFGFVAMASQEEREEAIAALNEEILEGFALRVSAAEEPDVTVSKAVPGGARVESPPPRHVVGPSLRLHVNNLSSKVDDSRLAQMFSQHGKVAYTKVVRDFHTKRSKGFGFVEMSSREEMDRAITALHGQSLEGRVIRVSAVEVPGVTVSKAAPGVESPPPRHVVGPSFRLHVNNLSLNVDDSRLARMFSQHGNVDKVVRDFHSERSKGFGFVEMASQEDMDNAITDLHGQSLEGRVIRVSAAEERLPS